MVEGLLKSKELLAKDQIVSPELVLYEAANTLWKHEHLLKDLKNGESYLSIFYGLIDAGKITLISPSENLMQESYLIAKRNGITIYDAIFVSLAIKLGLTLKTFDMAQTRTLKSERKKEPR
ncbi:MAG: type II toxin-antitoxin system VapC family toxin [Candidatus Bathyarchaeia archaeon]|jgi:predicted nucleic acid-binding protein